MSMLVNEYEQGTKANILFHIRLDLEVLNEFFVPKRNEF